MRMELVHKHAMFATQKNVLLAHLSANRPYPINETGDKKIIEMSNFTGSMACVSFDAVVVLICVDGHDATRMFINEFKFIIQCICCGNIMEKLEITSGKGGGHGGRGQNWRHHQKKSIGKRIFFVHPVDASRAVLGLFFADRVNS